MKGVILAGGTGTRLLAATKVGNKHLQLVYDRPMIYFPLQTLIDSGIEDILVICGGRHVGHFAEQLGDGSRYKKDVVDMYKHSSDFHVNLMYTVQEKAGGIPEALGLAKKFIGDEKCAVILGDNIFDENFKDKLKSFEKQENGALIFLKNVTDDNFLYRPMNGVVRAKFGIAETLSDKIVKVIEKPTPAESSSRLAITGLYVFTPDVFNKIVDLKPSWRGELEITDIIYKYINEDSLKYTLVSGFWSDAGTPETVLRTANYFANK